MTQKNLLPVVGIEQQLIDHPAASLVTILTELLFLFFFFL